MASKPYLNREKASDYLLTQHGLKRYRRFYLCRKLSAVFKQVISREVHPDDLPELMNQIELLAIVVERAVERNANNTSGRMV